MVIAVEESEFPSSLKIWIIRVNAIARIPNTKIKVSAVINGPYVKSVFFKLRNRLLQEISKRNFVLKILLMSQG